MRTMALAYVPPGVTVSEDYSSAVSPLLAANALVCLVGLGQGYETAKTTVNMATARDQDGDIVLNAPEGTVFATVSDTQVFESVANFNNPGVGQAANGDYLQGASADNDANDFTVTLNGAKTVATVVPNPEGAMDLASGFLTITYRYHADSYYTATRYDNGAAVEARYGPAFDANGVATPVSAAAMMAFENGADSVVIQPLFRLATPDDPQSARTQPNLTQYHDPATWRQTLAGLRDVEDVNVLVPVIGQSNGISDDVMLAIMYEVQNHIYFMNSQGQYIVGVFGEDSSADKTVAAQPTLQQHARNLSQRYDGVTAEQTVLVSPSRFTRRSTLVANKDFAVGGQLVAAAVAGMLANRPTSAPLTRKQVAGLTGVTDPRDKAGRDADAAAGLMVIEQRGTAIQVRHGLTVDTTGTARRELSVVRAKHRMIESIRTTLETQVIGTVPADGNAPLVVTTAVVGVLEQLRANRELIDYNNVQSRVLTNDPTTVECRFSYRPAFPLNYINIVFSLDLTSGDVDATTTDLTTG